jgi:hypothetical protein
MSEIVDLTTPVPAISQTQYTSALQFVVQALQAYNASLDLSVGTALEGLLCENQAYMVAVEQARMDQLEETFSLQAIVANETTVPNSYVDSLVSNYFLVRGAAGYASGPVNIIVSAPIPYAIPAGFGFTFSGLQFTTSQAFQVYPPNTTGVTTNSSTRIMSALANGTYQFTVNVTALTTGTSSALTAGTSLVIVNPLAGMLSASVATDFTGGAAEETNASLLARASQGITAQVLAGPAHIQATLTAEFPGTTVAVIGVGNPLMTRDRGNLFGMSTGSKQDLYCRTSQTIGSQTVTVNGTVTDGASMTVVIQLPYQTGIGVYAVTGILPSGLTAVGGITPNTYTVNTYLGTPFVPFILTPQDAAFSANAILSFSFTDTLSTGPLTTGQVISYAVTLLYMPTIQSIAGYATSDNIRTGDLLIKAAIPCSVTVSTTIRYPALTQPPAVSAVQNAISAAINALPFGTPSLSQYVVYTALAPLLTGGGDAIGTTMRGTIYSPAYQTIALPTSNELIIPTDSGTLALGVSADNTFFTCTPSQVVVNAVPI